MYVLLYKCGTDRGTVTAKPCPTWSAADANRLDVDVPVVRDVDDSPISESDILPNNDDRRLECECEYVLDPRFRTAARARDCNDGTWYVRCPLFNLRRLVIPRKIGK